MRRLLRFARNDRPLLFLVFRDVNNTYADGFGADGVQFAERFDGGGNLVLPVGVSGDDDGDGVVGAFAFVLEDA